MNIIIKPVITEKMTKMGDKFNLVGFIVEKSANKIQIKKAVEDLYGVKVEEVNAMIYPGKSKSRYTKKGFINGRTNMYKKAIVKLAEGEKIDFYSNI